MCPLIRKDALCGYPAGGGNEIARLIKKVSDAYEYHTCRKTFFYVRYFTIGCKIRIKHT